MAESKHKKQHTLKRLSLKPLTLKHALKVAVGTSLEDLKEMEAKEKRQSVDHRKRDA